MLTMNLSHFEAAFLFALFASVVLGIVTRKTDRERLQYGAKCFGYFILALVCDRLGDEAGPRLDRVIPRLPRHGEAVPDDPQLFPRR